jgi:hypothetical protein
MSLQILRNPTIHFSGFHPDTDILSGSIYGIYIYSERLSHILSGIYSDILSDSFSDILSGVYSDILSAILSGIYSDIPSLTSIPAFYLASVPSSRYGLGPGVDKRRRKGRKQMTRRGQARSEGVSERGRWGTPLLKYIETLTWQVGKNSVEIYRNHKFRIFTLGFNLPSHHRPISGSRPISTCIDLRHLDGPIWNGAGK